MDHSLGVKPLSEAQLKSHRSWAGREWQRGRSQVKGARSLGQAEKESTASPDSFLRRGNRRLRRKFDHLTPTRSGQEIMFIISLQ